MAKRKKPQADVEPQRPEKAELVAPEPHRPPALSRALQVVRAAVGAALDLADAAAEAVTKGLRPRS